ncbi:MAG: SMC-Scp complex subunit ScpB [Peptococcaceae bacterium]|nr:SMC-Scp complex subunit ScpB [Peptococcaceae bacterium]
MLFLERETAALEALLLVAKEPISAAKLAELINLNEEKIVELLCELRRRYADPASGFALVEVNGGYKLGTKAELAEYVEMLYKHPGQGLSGAALEVLAIVAYKQPVTRGEIDFLRGVQSDRALSTLAEKEMIREAGRKETPGRPILYGTTEKFLLHFHLKSLDGLPTLETLTPEETADGEPIQRDEEITPET